VAPGDLRTLFRLLFIAALAMVFVVALLPSPDVPAIVEGQDKVGHFTVFLLLTLLGLFAWPNHAFAVCASMLLYGLAIELAQSFTTYRQGDPWDWAADALGVVVALLLRRIANRSGSA
jgi:VanZ family protein